MPEFLNCLSRKALSRREFQPHDRFPSGPRLEFDPAGVDSLRLHIDGVRRAGVQLQTDRAAMVRCEGVDLAEHGGYEHVEPRGLIGVVHAADATEAVGCWPRRKAGV